MDQLICPKCNEPAGFNVFEDGPYTNHSVSPDREVTWEQPAVETEPVATITCNGCDAEPDGDLWDEICALVQG